MTGGHGLTRPLTATTKDPAARKQTAAAYVSDGLLDAVPFRQGDLGLAPGRGRQGNAIDTRGWAKRAPDDLPRLLLNL